MPYIKKDYREALKDPASVPVDSGGLNYLLTKTCLEYLDARKQSYKYYNDVIGALECSKLEMYRRAIAPYEDTKITENGDIYG